VSRRLHIDWEIQPLGEMPDSEIARQLGVSRERVRQIRSRMGIAPYAEPEPPWVVELGKRQDSEIGRRHGVSPVTVGRWRNQLGIARCPTRWDAEPDLGNVPDVVLARRHGVCHMTVARARWDRGISKFGVPFVDWDGDGDLDAMVAGSSRVWFNEGTGTFTESGQSLFTSSEAIVLGDLDGDGDTDLADLGILLADFGCEP